MVLVAVVVAARDVVVCVMAMEMVGEGGCMRLYAGDVRGDEVKA